MQKFKKGFCLVTMFFAAAAAMAFCSTIGGGRKALTATVDPAASAAPAGTVTSAATAASAVPNVAAASESEITDIILKDSSWTMVVGDEKQIRFSTKPKNAETDNLIWDSSNENVAEVDDSGKVTAYLSGKAKITVQTEDGNVLTSMDILVKPDKTIFASVKTKKKKVILKWERIDGVNGYQISYGRKKTFKGAKNKQEKAKSTITTINKLKSKKIYFFRIRSYATINGKNYYSEWSKIHKIKVK